MIDSNNIQEYLFDKYEGNLSISQMEELQLFLEKNPEYKADAAAWENSYVEKTEWVYAGQKQLLKPFFTPFRKGMVLLASLGILIGTYYFLDNKDENGVFQPREFETESAPMLLEMTEENKKPIDTTKKVTRNTVNPTSRVSILRVKEGIPVKEQGASLPAKYKSSTKLIPDTLISNEAEPMNVLSVAEDSTSNFESDSGSLHIPVLDSGINKKIPNDTVKNTNMSNKTKRSDFFRKRYKKVKIIPVKTGF